MSHSIKIFTTWMSNLNKNVDKILQVFLEMIEIKFSITLLTYFNLYNFLIMQWCFEFQFAFSWCLLILRNLHIFIDHVYVFCDLLVIVSTVCLYTNRYAVVSASFMDRKKCDESQKKKRHSWFQPWESESSVLFQAC